MFVELNDWQLTLRDETGRALYAASIGAAARGSDLVFGSDAHDQSRRFPQQFNNRYLYTLAPDPLAVAIGPARNHADLLYHHLRSLPLERKGELVIGVGGHVGNTQLGLLLGICQELELTVRGFIDNALLYALHADCVSTCHVMDIEQHRLVISPLLHEGTQRRVGNSRTIDGMGVASIVQGWMNVIADEFVQYTRFDPMHAGDSEQQVYDLVRGWLGQGTITEPRIRINHAESVRELDLDPQLLQEKLRQRIAGLDLTGIDELAITPRVAGLPFLASLLAERGCRVLTLTEDNARANLGDLIGELDPEQVRRITSCSVVADSSNRSAAAPNSATTGAPASHLLHGYVAFAFDHPSLRGKLDLDPPIEAGRQLTIDGRTFTAIRLE